jgi:hypothetical protein
VRSSEWITLGRDVALIGDDLSVDDARLIFMWSRMRVVDENMRESNGRGGRERIEHLTWWGFLEAMVRVAQCKALPTDAEVEAAGCSDGGEFLLELRKDPQAHREFIASHNKEWWQPLRQPIADALKQLLMLVMHSVSETLRRWEGQQIARSDRKKGTGGAKTVPEPPAGPQRKPSMTLQRSRTSRLKSLGGSASDLRAHLAELGSSRGSLNATSLRCLDLALDEHAEVQGHAATVINKEARRNQTRMEFVARRAACVTVQRYARGSAVRGTLHQQRSAATTIQSRVRGGRLRDAWRALILLSVAQHRLLNPALETSTSTR